MRPELLADQVMLEQVLLNLMRNGIEAMSEAPPIDGA
jgi:C4-dicarboxylate-specific signal transduction histidine kinase